MRTFTNPSNPNILIDGFVDSDYVPFWYGCASAYANPGARIQGRCSTTQLTPEQQGVTHVSATPTCFTADWGLTGLPGDFPADFAGYETNGDPRTGFSGYHHQYVVSGSQDSWVQTFPASVDRNRPCAIPHFFFGNPNPSLMYPIWRSDVAKGINRLSVTTHIFAPNTVFFAMSLYYNRDAWRMQTIGPCIGNIRPTTQTCAFSPFALRQGVQNTATFCNPSAGATGSTPLITTRAYIHFEDINGVAQTDIVYDFQPGLDIIDLYVGTDEGLDIPVAEDDNTPRVPYPNRNFNILQWGGQQVNNQFPGATKGVYVLPLTLPANYNTFFITGLDIVDITNGDPYTGTGGKVVKATDPVLGDGVMCVTLDDGSIVLASKVETTVWALGVFTNCVPFVPPADQVGLP